MKHTPTPYEVVDACTNEPAINAKQPYGMAGFLICPLAKGNCYGEVTGLDNAQFIVTACNSYADMLNALKAFQEGFDHFCTRIHFDKAFLDARAIRWMNETPIKVGEAIAKAEGKSNQ